MKKIKSLKDYINDDKLSESSLMSTSLAVGQRGRFFSNKSKLHSKISALQNSVRTALGSNEQAQQTEALLKAFLQLADIVSIQSEMETNLMQLVIALTLLHNGR